MMNLEHFNLDKRIALVTGASSGIGRALALGLAQAGAKIVAAARRVERLEQLVVEIEQAGGRALAVAMDVTDKDSIDAAYHRAEQALGVVDIIINNAGVAAPRGFLNTSDDTRDFIMNTNVNGVWHVAQAGARRLVDAGQPGSIVNIASVLGLGVQPGQAAYCASKGAVIQLTRAMAIDLMKYGIRVNAIAPGWFKTEINADYFDSAAGKAYIEQMPAKRLGRVEELIGPVMLLAGDAGSFINGAVLPVDGAIHARLS